MNKITKMKDWKGKDPGRTGYRHVHYYKDTCHSFIFLLP